MGKNRMRFHLFSSNYPIERKIGISHPTIVETFKVLKEADFLRKVRY
jgi:hypothetical protein